MSMLIVLYDRNVGLSTLLLSTISRRQIHIALVFRRSQSKNYIYMNFRV